MSKSIVQVDCDYCYLCDKYIKSDYVASEVHHIFGASDRKLSEKYGLTVRLCSDCHRAVHTGKNGKALMQMIHEAGQTAFERKYPALTFSEIFRKNYR